MSRRLHFEGQNSCDMKRVATYLYPFGLASAVSFGRLEVLNDRPCQLESKHIITLLFSCIIPLRFVIHTSSCTPRWFTPCQTFCVSECIERATEKWQPTQPSH